MPTPPHCQIEKQRKFLITNNNVIITTTDVKLVVLCRKRQLNANTQTVHCIRIHDPITLRVQLRPLTPNQFI